MLCCGTVGPAASDLSAGAVLARKRRKERLAGPFFDYQAAIPGDLLGSATRRAEPDRRKHWAPRWLRLLGR